MNIVKAYRQPITLCNSSDPMPECFFVFVNMNNPITKQNIQATHGITSGSIGEIFASEKLQDKYENGTIDYTPYIPNGSVDIHGLSMHSVNSGSSYRIEYNCELYRRQHEKTKLYPSRMSCIYAFSDYKSCVDAANKYHWDINSVKEFMLVKLPYTRVAKVNMEVISLIRGSEPIATINPEEQEKIWGHYWSGGGNMSIARSTEYEELSNSGVIWEYLVEGRLELIEN